MSEEREQSTEAPSELEQAQERVQALELRLQEAVLQQQIDTLESLSVQFGRSGASLDLSLEDPSRDDGQFWNEVGFGVGIAGGEDALPPRNDQDLKRGRLVSRRMARDNGYAIGALEARVSYIVGPGLKWKAVPRDPENEDEKLTELVNKSINGFSDANNMCELEQELVRRSDRDGEYFLRQFRQADRPLIVRVAEPEDVRDPTQPPQIGDGGQLADIAMGVEVTPGDVREVIAYWIADGEGAEPVRVASTQRDLVPAVIHHKINVDSNHRRGWPTLWPVRENLIRARRLLRNSGNVAAIQSAIVAIRKHKYATAAQVEAFTDRNRDALVTNNVTGKKTRFRGVGGPTILDTGPGQDYEAPIFSVNAANNVALIQADLREAASRLQMSESMFSADAAMTNFASALVAEGPVVRNFQRLQPLFAAPMKRLHWAAIHHDIQRGKLPATVPALYELQATPPKLEVRDRAGDTSANQQLHDSGVMSTRTWRGREGLDHEEEDRNLEQERAPAAGDVATQALGQNGGGNGTQAAPQEQAQARPPIALPLRG